MYIAIRNYPPYKIGDEITEERYSSLSYTERRGFQKKKKAEEIPSDSSNDCGGVTPSYSNDSSPLINGIDNDPYFPDRSDSPSSFDYGGGDGGGAGSSGSWGDSSSDSSSSSDSGSSDCGGGDSSGSCD